MFWVGLTVISICMLVCCLDLCWCLAVHFGGLLVALDSDSMLCCNYFVWLLAWLIVFGFLWLCRFIVSVGCGLVVLLF